MNESDNLGLPQSTRLFVDRLVQLGFDRERVFGFFTLTGLYAGAPNTQVKLQELFSKLETLLPIDRLKNLDEIVGEVYNGYDREINEFCYRSGLNADYFGFREIKIPNTNKSIFVVNLKDEGVLDTDVLAVNNLSDATRLFDAFMLALGKQSSSRGASLLEAFQCGIFQMQLHANSDVNGSMQIAKAIRSLLPPLFSRCFDSFTSAQLDYFLGLETGQLALLSLMHEMEQDYAQQMWGFQSSLFFREGKPLAGIGDLDLFQWHDWVIKNTEAFSEAYPSQLLPFSRSKITLTDLPVWNESVRSFKVCDQYINAIWGYTATKIENSFQSMEYKALVVHVIYSSLTSSRDVKH